MLFSGLISVIIWPRTVTSPGGRVNRRGKRSCGSPPGSRLPRERSEAQPNHPCGFSRTQISWRLGKETAVGGLVFVPLTARRGSRLARPAMRARSLALGLPGLRGRRRRLTTLRSSTRGGAQGRERSVRDGAASHNNSSVNVATEGRSNHTHHDGHFTLLLLCDAARWSALSGVL